MTEEKISISPKSIVLGDLAQVNQVHMNVGQNIIVITEDKLRIHLTDTAQRMEKRGAWIAPLGIFLSIVLTLVTSEFKERGLKASTWEAIFMIGAFASFIWLVYAMWVRPRSETVDQLITKIKK